jgi:hypothetical protein
MLTPPSYCCPYPCPYCTLARSLSLPDVVMLTQALAATKEGQGDGATSGGAARARSATVYSSQASRSFRVDVPPTCGGHLSWAMGDRPCGHFSQSLWPLFSVFVATFFSLSHPAGGTRGVSLPAVRMRTGAVNKGGFGRRGEGRGVSD